MQRRRKFMGHLPQKGTCMFGESDGTVPRDVLDSSDLAGGIELHESHSTIDRMRRQLVPTRVPRQRRGRQWRAR